jgi:hypothetical protein
MSPPLKPPGSLFGCQSGSLLDCHLQRVLNVRCRTNEHSDTMVATLMYAVRGNERIANRKGEVPVERRLFWIAA